MVVPAAAAEKVYEIAHGREVVEEIIKAELIANPGPPGKYYPFKPPIKPESPLGKLLTSKGVKFYSTRAGPAGLRPVMRSGAAGRAGGFGAGRRHMSTVPATMKAAVVRETGPADVLKVETDFPVPSIADGQVRRSSRHCCHRRCVLRAATETASCQQHRRTRTRTRTRTRSRSLQPAPRSFPAVEARPQQSTATAHLRAHARPRAHPRAAYPAGPRQKRVRWHQFH